MKKLSSLLLLLIASLSFTAFAQSMNCQLDISVTTKSGESVAGVSFELTHVDYSLVYPGTILDAQGKYSGKVYAGAHHIKIEKAGLATYEADFEMTTAGKQLNIELGEAVRLPFALKAETSHDIVTGKNNIVFTWNKEEPVFFDDFESYEGWTLNIGQWTGIDGDQLAAAALMGDYPNRGHLQYAQIVNPLKVDPVWWYEYTVLRPFSGQQYVGFIRTGSGEPNDDWFISPMVTIGNENVVSFMVKAGDRWPERFQVAITTAENPTPADFTIISSGNYETVGYEEWVKKEYDLSDYVGQNVKIAIHYISDASRYGAFMMMVDDFYIGQKEETQLRNVARRAVKSAANPNESFEIYLDGKKHSTTRESIYVFEDVASGKHTLGVKAVYATTSTDVVSIDVDVPADYAEFKLNVKANNNISVDGLTVGMIEKNRGEEYLFKVQNGAVVLPSLSFGTYLINIKSDAYEEYNSTLVFDKAASLDVVLKEIIFKPSNVTVNPKEDAEGKFDVTVSWNKDLGYNEGFESMPDFATGSFGGWRSVDVDKMPVYPIALGDITNVISFPGSGTQTAPTAIAPMVFNPYKTVPAMAPADPAIMAPEGDKTIAFFSTMQTKSDKWLIAPQQHINEGYVVRFAAKAYSSFPEIIEICISETGEVGDFVKLDKIQLETSWTNYEMDLSAYKDQKIYIGIHYISTDAFLAQLDMFYVGPKNEASAKVGKVLEYEVYLDNALVGKSAESSYTFNKLTAGSHTVGIKAIYTTGVSEITNYTFNLVAGVEDFETSSVAVVGLDGAVKVVVPQVADVVVFNMAGQVVAEMNAVEGEAVLPVNAGMYIVKVGTEAFKVAVR